MYTIENVNRKGGDNLSPPFLPRRNGPVTVASYCSARYGFNSGIARIINSSNNGTVNAMSPYAGL